MTLLLWGVDFTLMPYNFRLMRKPTTTVGLCMRLKLRTLSFNNLPDLVPHNAEVFIPHKPEVPPGIYAKAEVPPYARDVPAEIRGVVFSVAS